MRIYTRVVCAWQPDGTLKQEEAESFDYEGPVALCKDAGSPPAAPDYAGAARTTAESSRTNQYTPFGNLVWTPGTPAMPGTGGHMVGGGWQQTPEGGTEQVGGHMVGGTPGTPETPWSSRIELNPEAQNALSAQMRTSTGMSQLGEREAARLAEQFAGPSSVQDIADKAYAAQTSRLDPQWASKRSMEETRLRNQGLVPGGEAYGDARRTFDAGENDAYMQARLAADATMPMTYNMQYTQPLNTLNAIRSGGQVQTPQFAPQGAGANMLGAAQAGGQYSQGLYGANVAEANAGNQQTGQLASTALMAMMMY